MLNPRRVLSKSQILQNVWHYDFGGSRNVVETYVSYLRRKLDAAGPPLIRTVRQFGYMLEAEEVGGPAALAARSTHPRRDRPRGLGLVAADVVTYTSLRSFLISAHRRLPRHGALLRGERAARPESGTPASEESHRRPRLEDPDIGRLEARVPGLFVQVRRPTGRSSRPEPRRSSPARSRQRHPVSRATIALDDAPRRRSRHVFHGPGDQGRRALPRSCLDRPEQRRVHADRRHVAEQRRQHTSPARPGGAARHLGGSRRCRDARALGDPCRPTSADRDRRDRCDDRRR